MANVNYKYRNVSNPNVSDSTYAALRSIEEYGYKGDIVITGLTRSAERNKAVGGATSSKHLSGDGIDFSSKDDNKEFINWLNTDQGKKWQNDYSIKLLDETKGKAPHYHVGVGQPKVNIDKYKNEIKDIRKDGLVNFQKAATMAKPDTKTEDKKSPLDIIQNEENKLNILKLKYEREKEFFDPGKNKVLYNKIKEQEQTVNDLKSNFVQEQEKRLEIGYAVNKEKYEKEYEEAYKSGDIDKATQLNEKLISLNSVIKDFEKNKIDWTKSKDETISTAELNKRPGAFSRDIKSSVKNLDYGQINTRFDEYKKNIPISKPEEKIVDKPKAQTDGDAKGTGKSSGTTTTDSGVPPKPDAEYVNDMKFAEGEGQEQNREFKNDEDLKEIFRPDIKEFVPMQQKGASPWEDVLDIGRMAMSWGDMTQDVPTYQRGDMWNEAMADARAMKNMGFTPDEMSLYKNLAERGYAYDVSNIRRLAGGSSGVALGNLGRATSQLYGQYGKIAAEDARLRRQNMQNFQQMAGRDEVINRQIFQDELSNVLREIEGAGAAFGDAMENIQERRDYNRQYGPGSMYEQYMNKIAEREHYASQYQNALAQKWLNEGNSGSSGNGNSKETPSVDSEVGKRVTNAFKTASSDEIKNFTEENKYSLGSTGRSVSQEVTSEEQRPYGGTSLTNEMVQQSKDKVETDRLKAEAEADALINGNQKQRKGLFRRR